MTSDLYSQYIVKKGLEIVNVVHKCIQLRISYALIICVVLSFTSYSQVTSDSIIGDTIVATPLKINIEYNNEPIYEFSEVSTSIITNEDVIGKNGSGHDILINSTFTNVDVDGNLSFRGNANFLSLKNGLPSILKGANQLEQVHGINISKIEVFNIAPVYYDVDGGLGVINLITKTGSFDSTSRKTNGSIFLRAGSREKYSYSHWFQYNAKRISFYNSLNLSSSKFGGSILSDRLDYIVPDNDSLSPFVDTFSISGAQIRLQQLYETESGLSYLISPKNKISISLINGIQEHNLSGKNRLRLANTFVENDGSGQDQIRYNRGVFKYEFTKNKNSRIELIGTYGNVITNNLSIIDETLYDYKWSSITGPGLNLENHSNVTKYETRLRLNYYRRFEKFDLVAGGQLLNDNYNFEQFVLSRLNRSDPFTRSGNNIFQFDRNLLSTYLSMDRIKISNDIIGYVGGRVEVMNQSLNDIKNESNIYPFALIQYGLNKDLKLIGRYGSRINRASASVLSPITIQVNPGLLSRGNPNLKNEQFSLTEIELQKSSNNLDVILTGFYQRTSNEIQSVQTIEDHMGSSIKVNSYTNVKQRSSVGFESKFLFEPKYNVTINGSFSLFNTRLQDIDFNTRDNWNKNAQLVVKVPFIAQSKLQLTSRYVGKTIGVVANFDDFITFNLGISKSLLNDKLSVDIFMTDVLNTRKYNGFVDISSRNLHPNATTNSRDVFELNRESRIGYFAINYKF